MPDFELNTMRQATGAIFFFSASIITGKSLPVPRSEVLATLCLGFLSFGTAICIFVSVTYIPLSTEQAIQMSSMILSGILLFSMFWSEKIYLRNLLFAGLCIAGVVLVIQPGIIFKINTDDSKESDTSTSSAHFILSVALSAAAGVGYSLSVLLLKKNPYLSENLTNVLFWSFSFGTFLSAASMAILEIPTFTSDWEQILLISGHCSSFVVGWIMALYAVKHISGNLINIIASTSVVLMLVPQYTFLSSILPGHKNWMEVLGVVLILLGSIMGSVIELCKSRQRKTE